MSLKYAFFGHILAKKQLFEIFGYSNNFRVNCSLFEQYNKTKQLQALIIALYEIYNYIPTFIILTLLLILTARVSFPIRAFLHFPLSDRASYSS